MKTVEEIKTMLNEVKGTVEDFKEFSKTNEKILEVKILLKMEKIKEIFNKYSEILKEIRELRKLKRFCTSADDKYDINSLLKEIIGKEVYKNDYENVTDLITYDHIKYDETIKTIQKIIEHKVF